MSVCHKKPCRRTIRNCVGHRELRRRTADRVSRGAPTVLFITTDAIALQPPTGFPVTYRQGFIWPTRFPMTDMVSCSVPTRFLMTDEVSHHAPTLLPCNLRHSFPQPTQFLWPTRFLMMHRHSFIRPTRFPVTYRHGFPWPTDTVFYHVSSHALNRR